MSEKLQPVRGTKDVLPDDFRRHQFIVTIAYLVGELYGYEGMSTPVFEFTDIFKRTLGDTSDVVNKEMYSFEDRGGESITLRPEFTAGVARSVISNGLQQSLPIKFFSYGPLFRYERPQKGRQRQFHQINFEHIGERGATADVEIISMAKKILDKLNITEGVSLEINSLGDAESRKAYRDTLVGYLSPFKERLSEDSRERLEKNPLRILDSKDEGDKEIIKNAPVVSDYFTEESARFFDDVKRGLNSLGIEYNINPKIVRGLDYYNHTVFEFVVNSEELGSQNTAIAGGRYDGLIEQMGGTQTPAVGFAAGIERLALLTNVELNKKPSVAVIPEVDANKGLQVAAKLRGKGVVSELFAEGKFDKRMKKANKVGAEIIVIIKEDGSIVAKSDSHSGKEKAKKIEEFLQ